MKFKYWLDDNWIWILLVVVVIAVILFGMVYITPERSDSITAVLVSPVSEVKLWQLLLGIYFVILISPSKSSGK
ncbi:MAG TPA: hypothetical protein VMX17_06530 [Candidatus Glassbacteria bacterium]|nr:hypothetical protein [Candidatus Glassbacteria bacterium]